MHNMVLKHFVFSTSASLDLIMLHKVERHHWPHRDQS